MRVVHLCRGLLPLLLLLAASGCEGDGGLRDVQVHLSASPPSLAFGPVPVGRARTLPLTVQASRTARAQVQWRTSGPTFSLREAPTRLEGALLEAQVAWQPLQEGREEGWLEVGLEGAPESEWVRVALVGEGLPADSCRPQGACQVAVWEEASGTCTRGPAADGTACASACLTDAACVAGECRGSRPPCDDGNACTTDVCVEGEGCRHDAVACPSPSPCQVGVCDAARGCTSEPAVDGTPCGPLQGCSSAEVCLSGVCSTVDPPDGTACALPEAHPCLKGVCAGSGCQAVVQEVTAGGALCPPEWEHCAGGTFLPWPAIPLSLQLGTPLGLALGDVNGDGRPDAVVDLSSGRLAVLLGLGDGRFTGPLPQAGLEGGQLVAVADLDGQGRAEVLLLERPGVQALRVLRGTPEGRLEEVQRLVLGARAGKPLLGDVDGDGLLDVAVPLPDSGAVQLLHGLPGGALAPWGQLQLGETSPAVALGDINGDDLLDLAAILPSAEGVGVWRGAGDGTFAPLGRYVPASRMQPHRLALADLDGSGRAELVVTAVDSASQSGRVEVAELDEGGTFLLRDSPDTGSVSIEWAADLTGEGRPDVLLRHWNGALLLMHHDTKKGRYLLGTLPLEGAGYLSAVADVDGDGLQDVASIDARTGALTVHRGLGAGAVGTSWSRAFFSARALRLLGAGNLGSDGGVALVGCGETGEMLAHRYRAPRDFTAVSTPPVSWVCEPALAAVLPGVGGERGRVLLADAQGQMLRWLGLPRDITLEEEGRVPLPEVPSRLATGDLDGDGRLDALLLDEAGTGARAWLQRALPFGFVMGPQSHFDTPVGQWQLAQLDGDGKADLLLGLLGSGGAEVRLGLGDGSFSGPLSYLLPARADTVLTADLTADGVADVLFCPLTPGTMGLEVWRSEGGGSFVPHAALSLSGSPPLVPTLADLDGDGKVDLLARGGEGQLFVLRGLGGTRFSPPEQAWMGGGRVVVQDLDGDGRKDVAASDWAETGELRVLWNSCGP